MSGADDANAWTQWTPPTGWDGFGAHQALSDAIWSGLSEADGAWHYLNPAGELSIWEYSADGSAIVIDYRGDRIVALQTRRGGAERYLLAIAAAFGLIAQPGVGP